MLKPSNVTVFSNRRGHPDHSYSIADALGGGYLVVTLDDVRQEHVAAFDIMNGFIKTYVPAHTLELLKRSGASKHSLRRIERDGMRSKGVVRVFHV